MRAANRIGPTIAGIGAVALAGALLMSPGRAAQPSHDNRPPVEQLDVWRVVVCDSFPPLRRHCVIVDDVAPLPLGACSDLARGLQPLLPPPAAAGCLVDTRELAAERGW